jgi:anti-sigma-K factor RskA
VGVINSHGDTLINLAGLDSKLADGALFAVSIEPPGGSTSGTPGRVVCKGTIAWIPQRVKRAPSQT